MLLKKHETEYRFMEKKKKLLLDQMEELTLANQAISRKLKVLLSDRTSTLIVYVYATSAITFNGYYDIGYHHFNHISLTVFNEGIELP